MSLKPSFSLTPTTPISTGYDAQNPGGSYLDACIYHYGGMSRHTTGFNLADQCKNDEIILGGNPLPLTASFFLNTGKVCGIGIAFKGVNVSTKNQYLVVMALRETTKLVAGAPPPTAQIYVSGRLARAEELKGEETIAVLVNCPGDQQHVHMHVVLAGPEAQIASPTMAFKGVHGYLL